MKNNTSKWYTRRDGVISGPFSRAVISNNILLGRLSTHDEVSHDQKSWHLILTQPLLNPEFEKKSFKHSKRRLDERDGFDRRQSASTEENILQQRKQDRREPEDNQILESRQLRSLLLKQYRQHKEQLYWPISIILIIMVLTLVLAILFPTQLANPQPNCMTPPGPNINWSNCSKPKLDLHDQDLSNAQFNSSKLIGANFLNTNLTNSNLAYADLRFSNLSYSQLQNSNLVGANLQKADLSNADIRYADFSFADLSSANIGGTLLKGAIFDYTIWHDGQICAEGSIGTCITHQP
jgi:uncharacterized protein YjbI with pentapeptide repeats